MSPTPEGDRMAWLPLVGCYLPIAVVVATILLAIFRP